MSVRALLLAALSGPGGLPASLFRVSTSADVPDQLDPGLLNVRLFTNSVTPGPTLGLLTYSLELWISTPVQDTAGVDTVLDDGLDVLLSTLLTLPQISFVNAERTTMQDQWFAYKVALTAYAQTEGA